MNRIIRIGSRDSDLALWQANTVKARLEELGVGSEIIPIQSEGDLITDVPLYELGITGIFTRSLDVALLKDKIDIAVHSMKDVPTQLPKGIVKAAVLERANPTDVLIHKGLDFLNAEGILATGSLRRKAQWLHRYPLHTVVDLRGNVPTRLRKLKEESWNAAIFATAGLERLKQLPEKSVELQWMVPAPAQGAILVVAQQKDQQIVDLLKPLNHHVTDICTSAEREFLRELEGGCSAPIGALARMEGEKICFKGVLGSVDGKQLLRVEQEADINSLEGLGRKCAKKILSEGGGEILNTLKSRTGL
ncbi:MAG: hydroxymethylbilane synthase [Flavobacteriaceae bacterium]